MSLPKYFWRCGKHWLTLQYKSGSRRVEERTLQRELKKELKQVILDRYLAQLYQVEVSQMNRQVKRNIERFPDDFMFQITREEWNGVKESVRGGKNLIY